MITLSEADKALKQMYLDVLQDDITPKEKQQYNRRENVGWNKLDEEARESRKGMKAKYSMEKPTKIGRNELCPCGSGKKYKKCCLGKED